MAVLFIIGENDNSLNVQHRGLEKQIVVRLDYEAALKLMIVK